MQNAVIDGYITEQKLGVVFSKIFDSVEKQYKVNGYQFRWDFYMQHNGINYVVEYDGYQHYTSSVYIRRDIEKDKIVFFAPNTKIVRIPYFTQLTNETFEYYFGFKCPVNIVQDFPHGFIDKKAILPACYCELGINRFWYELNKLPDDIKISIINSLKERKKELHTKFIIPQLLHDKMKISGLWY